MSAAIATRKNPAIVEPERPRVPALIAQAIADPYRLDDGSPSAAWETPAKLPEAGAMEAALASLRAGMRPATPAWIAACLTRIAGLTNHRDASRTEWKARTEEYVRLLGHVPPDIWWRCADQAILASKFFPTIAELNKLMTPELERRGTAIWRLQTLLHKAQAEAEKPFVPDPQPVKLKAIVDSWLRLRNDSAVKAVLARSAINAEIELARIEGRPPAEWVAKPAAEEAA